MKKIKGLSACGSAMVRQATRFARLLALGGGLALVASCGGGGGAVPVAPNNASNYIAGRIADGYIRGALVFWDCNGNMKPDAGELTTVSTFGGAYTLPAAPAAKPPLLACSLRALIPAEAIDEDNGQVVGSSYSMSAIDGNPEFISPLTTALNLGAFTEAELIAKFPPGTKLSFASDYIAAGEVGKQFHNAAKFIAISLQSIHGLIGTDDALLRKGVLDQAFALVPAEAFKTLNATDSKLASFKSESPILDAAVSVVSATLDRAKFELVESAFTGADDPRRKFVLMALESVSNNPGVVFGNTVSWRLIPDDERRVWSTQIQSGSNGFVDAENVTSIRELLKTKQQLAAVEIEAEKNKVISKMATILAKNAAEMTITSIDSAVKILPATSQILRVLGVAKLNKLKLGTTRATTVLKRIENLTTFTTSCADIASDLSFVQSLPELTDTSKLIDISVSVVKCVAGLSKSPKVGLIFEDIAAGKSFVEGAQEGDLIALLKALSDAASATMDFAGLSVASAIYNETLGMFISSQYALNELNKTANKATDAFEVATKNILDRFAKIADSSGSAMISARLSPFIRPKYLINISVPVSTEVGKNVMASIEQLAAQSIAYEIDWGRYPNGISVTETPTLWSYLGGAVTLPPIKYAMPGTYDIQVRLYDTSLGGKIVPFQFLSSQIKVDCPIGKTVTPDGDCDTPPVGLLNPDNGNRYEVIVCGTWTQCDFEARKKGGNLVTIRSITENDWILANFGSLANTVYGFWIGQNDISGKWAWKSGALDSYTNWDPGEPNGLSTDHYAHMYARAVSNKTPGTWNDTADNAYGIGVTQGIVEHVAGRIIIEAASFVKGEGVAMSANGYGADALMNGPPYSAVANAAEWAFNVPISGRYELFAEYAAAVSRPVTISFNGLVKFRNALAAGTGGWYPGNRQAISQGIVDLAAGATTMRVDRHDVFPHIRGFRLVPFKP